MTQQRGIAFAQAIRLDEVSALREQRGAAGEFCLVGRQPLKGAASESTLIRHAAVPTMSFMRTRSARTVQRVECTTRIGKKLRTCCAVLEDLQLVVLQWLSCRIEEDHADALL